jgi:CRISPR-associated protein Cmr6
LSPYGLPYLPASGVKGVLRQAARELARGDWGDTAGWSEDRCYLLAVDKQRIPLSMLDALFGKETEDRDTDQVRGALTFWDVFPLLKGDALQVEVMTAHQTHYYQGGQSPHESGSPNPINFLTVPPGSELAFHVRCDIPHLGRLAPDLARDNRWQALLCAAFAHAFQWLGFGAKTAVGYGAMARDMDREAKQRQTWEAQERQAARAEEEQRAEEDRARRLAEMDPLERAIQEFLDTRTDKVQSEISAVIAAVRQGRWAGEERQGVARWLKARMQATKGQWKESSQAKKPEKDKEYQNTLQVNAWLG